MSEPRPVPAAPELERVLRELIERMTLMENRMDALAERLGRLAPARPAGGPAERAADMAPPASAAGPAAPAPVRPAAVPPAPTPPAQAVVGATLEPAEPSPAAPHPAVGPRPAPPPPSLSIEHLERLAAQGQVARPASPAAPVSPPVSAARPAPGAPATPAPISSAGPAAPRPAGASPAGSLPPAAVPARPPTQPVQATTAPPKPQAPARAVPAAPVAASQAAPSAVAAPTAPAASQVGSIEQKIGLKWMLLGGLALLLLGVILFYQHAVNQGWINERVRLALGTAAGLLLLGVGEWAFRRRLKLWAAAVIGGGIVLLYAVAFLASPNGPTSYRLTDSTGAAFGAMCGVTLIGIALSVRTSLQITAVVALVGALTTPVLLSTGHNRQVELLSYLLAVDAGFLVLALMKRWPALSVLSLVGTILLFAGWFERFYALQPTVWTTSSFGWAFFLLFVAYATAAGRMGRLRPPSALALAGISALLLGILACLTCNSIDCRWGLCLQLATLEGLTLLAAYLVRGPLLAPVIMLAVSALFAAWYSHHYSTGPMTDAVTALAWLHVAMIFAFGLAHWRRRQDVELVILLFLASAAGAGGALLAAWQPVGAEGRWAFAMQWVLLEGAALAALMHIRQCTAGFHVLAGASGLFAAWYASLYARGPMVDAVTAAAWLHAGLYAAWCVLHVRRSAPAEPLAGLILGAVAGTGAALVAAWRLEGADARWAVCIQLALLEALTLAVVYRIGRPQVALFAMGLLAAVFAAWYAPLHRASPMPEAVLTLAWLHVGMFAVCTLAQWRRGAGVDLTGTLIILTAVSGGAVMVAACNQLVLWPLLAGQVLLLTVGLLVASARVMDWPGLTLLTFLTAHNVMLGWFSYYYQPWAAGPICIYCWCVTGLAAATALLVRRPSWDLFHTGNLLLAGVVSTLAWGFMREALAPNAYLAQTLVLDVLVLAFCWRRDWHLLRPAAMAWSAAVVLVVLIRRPLEPWLIAPWAWTFFGLFTADLLARAVLRRREAWEHLECSLASAATGLMYWATYRVLHGPYPEWMGGYTAALGSAAIVLGVLLRLRLGRLMLGTTYITQGLVLLTMAVPLQFDFSAVTIAWSVQGVIAAFLARRLGSRLLLLKSPVVLGLAAAHFLLIELPNDPTVHVILGYPLGVALSFSLVLAVVLTAALLGAGAILRDCRLLRDEMDMLALSTVLSLGATWLFFHRAAVELPALACTWWWLVYAGLLAGVAVWRRSDRLMTVGLLLLLLVLGRWTLVDTVGTAVARAYSPGDPVVFNWQFGAGLALACVVLGVRRGLGRLGEKLRLALAPWEAVWFPLAAMLVLWAGTFEIDRYFALPEGRALANRVQATQMAYSLWWGLGATVCLVAGFILAHRVLRLLALVIFGVTVAKVFLVDLQHVQAIFRILSFMGLGVLLLAGSYLYHVRFRRSPVKAAEGNQPQPAAGPGPERENPNP